MRGIWFYGLAGSGKSFASKLIASKKKRGFVVDGDDVRRLINTELGYSVADRKVQTTKLLGIAELCLLNGFYPIVSSVTMNLDLSERCKILDIEVVKIVRPLSQLKAVRKIYSTEKEVVGVDIDLHELGLPEIQNDGTHTFEKAVLRYV